MYEQLIKDLQYCGGNLGCTECSHSREKLCLSKLQKTAVAALEEMNRLLDAAVNDIPHDCYHCVDYPGGLTMCEKGKSINVVYPHCPYWKWRGCTRSGAKHIEIEGVIPDGEDTDGQ